MKHSKHDQSPLMKKITESTMLPISLVITLAGGGVYVKGIACDADGNSEKIERVEKRYIQTTDKIFETLVEIKERVARIEANQNRGK